MESSVHNVGNCRNIRKKDTCAKCRNNNWDYSSFVKGVSCDSQLNNSELQDNLVNDQF